MTERFDVVVVGASFAGLSCATQLAESGLKTCVLERKKDPGEGLHTTGIIVKEAAPALDVPADFTNEIRHIRLYSPSLSHVDLHSEDYFFLATETRETMRHLAARAEQAGVRMLYGAPFTHGETRTDGSIVLSDHDLACEILVGADGPRSSVARDFDLGRNDRFLLGVEAEFSRASLPSDQAFYCFLNRKLAYGYLGWVVAGVDVVQVGLATRLPVKPDIDAFIDYVTPLFRLDKRDIIARRGGLIPVGGIVRPVARGNVILLGDAAGTVSPFSGGGIHTADHYGKRLARHITAYLKEGGPEPAAMIARDYPRFRVKHALRFVFETFVFNWMFDLLIGGRLFELAARNIFFKSKRLSGGHDRDEGAGDD